MNKADVDLKLLQPKAQFPLPAEINSNSSQNNCLMTNNAPSLVSMIQRKSPKNNKTKKKEKPQNFSSVHLLKLGNTYHSLGDMTEDQRKLIAETVKNIDPDKGPPKPSYDAASNTRIIYKFISPSDLKVVGKKSEIVLDEHTNKKNEDVTTNTGNSESPKILAETDNVLGITRSGRTVKLPKHIRLEEKLKKKPKQKFGNIMSCLQCSVEFCGLYRLQRHYEKNPTHIPSNVHASLFQCLLSILKSKEPDERTTVFIQELEQLIEKLRSLLPCLLKKIDGNEGISCMINEDVGKLFGMNPGKYNLNVDALNCIKDKDGHCKHKPPKNNNFLNNSDLSKPSQLWLSKHKEETAKLGIVKDDCARTNSVDRWHTFNKRLMKYRQPFRDQIALKRKKQSHSNGCEIDMNMLVNHETFNVLRKDSNILTMDNTSPTSDDVILVERNPQHRKEISSQLPNVDNDKTIPSTTDTCKLSSLYLNNNQFDIPSCPRKTSSNYNTNTTNKKYEGNRLKSLFSENYNKNDFNMSNSDDLDLNSVLKELHTVNENTVQSNDRLELNSKNVNLDNRITYSHISESPINTLNKNDSQQNFSGCLFNDEPLLSADNNSEKVNESRHIIQIENNSRNLSHGQSMLNLLGPLANDCLTFSDAELRNSTMDLPLDLFSFHNA